MDVSNGTVFRDSVMQITSVVRKKPVGFVAPQRSIEGVNEKPGVVTVNKAFLKKAYCKSIIFLKYFSRGALPLTPQPSKHTKPHT